MNGQQTPWWDGAAAPPPHVNNASHPHSNNNSMFVPNTAYQQQQQQRPGYPVMFQQQQAQYMNGGVPPPPPPTQQHPMPFYGSSQPPMYPQQWQTSYPPASLSNIQKPPPPPPPLPPGRPPPPPPSQQNFQQQQQLGQLYPDPQSARMSSPPTVAPPPPPQPSPSIVPQQVRNSNNNRKRQRQRSKKSKEPETIAPVPKEDRGQIKVGEVFHGEVIRHKAQVPTQHHYGTRGMSSFAEQLDAKAAALREMEVVDLTGEQEPNKKRAKVAAPVQSKAEAKKKKARPGRKARKRKANAAAAAAEMSAQTTSNAKEATAQNTQIEPALWNAMAIEKTSTATTDNKKANKSRQALEEVKARLLQAKLKKQEMEAKLQSESIASEGSREDTVSATSTTSTGDSAKAETKSKASAPVRSTKAQAAFAKLEAARSKLRGALKNRERAMRTDTQPANNGSRLPPLSALSSSLIIRNISQTGSRDKVYISEENADRAAVEEFLGIDMIEALHSKDPLDHEDFYLSNDSLQPTTKPSMDDPTSLATRKQQLQQELMALKEKLEKSQQKAGVSDAAQKRVPITLTKEELEKRKAEAQNTMDISYWKHFVSKQEVLLEQVTEKITANESALEECQKESHETNKNLLKTQNELDELESRKQIVEEGIASSMSALLQARQALYEARQGQSAGKSA